MFRLVGAGSTQDPLRIGGDLDYLPPLGEGDAIARRGAIASDNYSDSATHVTRGLVRGSDWLGRLGLRKGMKPSRFLKSSPP
jgi:hypothetical protein